jgi:hypothetical protein
MRLGQLVRSSAYSVVYLTSVGGFTVVYFQVKWVTMSGPAITFGCQAAVVAFFIVSIIVTQIKGSSWRQSFPPPQTGKTN